MNDKSAFVFLKVLFQYYTHISCNYLKPLSANSTKWSNTLKQFIDKSQFFSLSVFDHVVGLALKGLTTELNN